MVRAAPAGADSPADHRHVAQANPACNPGAVYELAFALAACGYRFATARRAGTHGSFTTTAGVRSPGALLGAAHFGEARRQLRSANAGPIVPHGRGRLGTLVAAFSSIRGAGRHATARYAHQRHAHYFFRAGRCGMDVASRSA